MASEPARPGAASPMTRAGRALVLIAAFLGWMFAGVQMGINSLALRNAAEDLLEAHFVSLGISAHQPGPRSDSESNGLGDTPLKRFDKDGDRRLSPPEQASAREATIGQWFGWLTAAFLLGAAVGGYLFGWCGDRYGRARAMGYSILCYSAFSGLSVFVRDPWHLLVLRFVTCLGVGGIWPNGIALVSEAWPNISRPFLAGAIGTAANIGIMLMSLVTMHYFVTTGNWRWVMWVGAAPAALGLVVLIATPESPRWLTMRAQPGQWGVDIGDVFRPPVLATTLLGIALGTVPLFGGWGCSNWANAWAGQVGDPTQTQAAAARPDAGAKDAGSTAKSPDPALKSQVLLSRSLPGSVSSLLGGALALMLGRRVCYFVLSAAALGSAQILFSMYEPGSDGFLFWNGALGFFSGFFFGWLPLCLPEMFPTRVRSAGAGVSFNFGRILTAVGVLTTGGLLNVVFGGNYSAVGRTTSLVYALGMVLILFAPETSRQSLDT